MLYQLSYIHRSRGRLYCAVANVQVRHHIAVFACLIALSGCAHHPAPASVAVDHDALREQIIADLESTRRFYFESNAAFGPAVTLTAQTQTRGGVEVRAQAVRLEAEPWNAWPDGTARLLNDTVAFGVRVEIHGDDVRWDPSHTELAVNTTEQVFPPALSADQVLDHLLWLARHEAELGLPPDAQLRLRNAEGLRAAYLPSVSGEAASGVILFPAPAGRLFAFALQLTLGVELEGGRVEEFVFLFE